MSAWWEDGARAEALDYDDWRETPDPADLAAHWLDNKRAAIATANPDDPF